MSNWSKRWRWHTTTRKHRRRKEATKVKKTKLSLLVETEVVDEDVVEDVAVAVAEDVVDAEERKVVDMVPVVGKAAMDRNKGLPIITAMRVTT